MFTGPLVSSSRCCCSTKRSRTRKSFATGAIKQTSLEQMRKTFAAYYAKQAKQKNNRKLQTEDSERSSPNYRKQFSIRDILLLENSHFPVPEILEFFSVHNSHKQVTPEPQLYEQRNFHPVGQVDVQEPHLYFTLRDKPAILEKTADIPYHGHIKREEGLDCYVSFPGNMQPVGMH